MNQLKRVALIGAALVASTAGLALAGTKQATDVTILEKTTLNGKELTPGPYKITWDGDTGDVKVSVMKGREVVAEGQARWEERNAAPENGGVVTHRNGSGESAIKEIRMAGKKSVLVLAGS